MFSSDGGGSGDNGLWSRRKGIATFAGSRSTFGHANSKSGRKLARQGGPNPAMGKGGKSLAGYSTIWYVEVELLLYQTKVGSLCIEPTSKMCAALC